MLIFGQTQYSVSISHVFWYVTDVGRVDGAVVGIFGGAVGDDGGDGDDGVEFRWRCRR